MKSRSADCAKDLPTGAPMMLVVSRGGDLGFVSEPLAKLIRRARRGRSLKTLEDIDGIWESGSLGEAIRPIADGESDVGHVQTTLHLGKSRLGLAWSVWAIDRESGLVAAVGVPKTGTIVGPDGRPVYVDFLKEMEHLPIGFLIADFEEHILYANSTFCKMVERDLEELIGRPLTEFVLPEDRTLLHEQTALRKKGRSSTYTLRVRTRQGTIRHLEIHAVPRATDETLSFASAAVIDVTDRERVTAELRRERMRLMAIAIASSDAIAIVDASLRIQFWSSAAERLFGYSVDDASGKSIVELVVPTESRGEIRRLLAPLIRGNQAGGKQPREIELMRKDGSRFLAEVSTGVAVSDTEVSIVFVCRDVTEKKMAQLEREQAHRELKLYASVLRHDLTNDIALLLSNLDLGRQLIARGDIAAIEELINTCDTVLERSLEVIKAFGKPSEKGIKNLLDLVCDVVRWARSTYPGLVLRVNVSEVKDVMVAGSSLLPMVLQNLIRNSVMHGTSRPEVTVTARLESNDVVYIDVEDNGPGVDPSIRDRLFARGVSTRSSGGFGLYLSREILRSLGGDLELIDTAPGEGAHFRITLPVLRPGY